MEEKKIIYKSIDEKLAEDERITATAPKSSDKAVERATTGPKRGRKKLRLKKSARRTIGSLMIATSIVIGAIPTGGVSAGSPDTYGGSKKAAPDIETERSTILAGDTTSASCTVPVTALSKTHYGGFPIIAETDPTDPDKYVPTDFGKHQFYVVDYHGFKSEDYVRPIYSLDAGKSNIEKYFEKNGEGDPYIPPSGKLNLVTGYVDQTTMADTDEWEFDGRLYKSKIVDFNLQVPDGSGYTPYSYTFKGRQISVYDKKTLKMWHVKYMLDDGVTPYWEKDIVDGKKLSTINPPDDPPEKEMPDGSKKTGYWTPTPLKDDPVTSDLTFTAYYGTTTPRKGENGPLDETLLPGDESSSADGNGETEETTGSDNTEQPAPEGTTEQGEENSQNPIVEIPDNSQDQGTGDASAESNTGEGGEAPELINVESEHADAGNFGLNGILLYTYNGTEYNDNPSEVFYVCDKYAPITNICDEAFKGTENINSVELPKNFDKIGNSAFAGCTGIREIALGNGLSSIGASAFENCASLASIAYTDLSPLKTIGALAFAGCSSLTTFSDSGSGFTFPKNLEIIGNGAFYGASMTTLDFSTLVIGCNVGNYAFNRCKALTEVELDGTNTTIKNLKTVEGLFRECEKLKKVNMPDEFVGAFKKDTFGRCYDMALIIFNNSTSGIAEDAIYNEFDNKQIIVEGPRPEIDSSTNVLKTPEDSSVLAYKDCLKVDSSDNSNNYTYRYRVSETEYYDYCNVKATQSGTTTNEKNDFVFEVRNDGMITHEADRGKFGTDLCDLAIGDTVGENEIFISGIDNNVFKDNKSIVNLTLPTTIHSVGQSAFESCDKLNSVIITTNNTTDGTDLKEKAFFDNPVLKYVTYKYNGDGLCAIRSECFKDCPSLEEVRFLAKEDGDYINGSVGSDKDVDKYAKFSTGGIAANAFEYEPRTSAITFVGPMKAGYTPYLFAIGKGDYSVPGKISKNEIYILYKTENPRNLVCSYRAENNNATVPANPVYAPIKVDDTAYTSKYSESLINSVPHYDKYGKFITPAGVYLLEYPNRTTYIDYSDDPSAKPVPIDKIDTWTGDQRTNMVSAIVNQTKDITVPYGIDFIDYAESTINAKDTTIGIEKDYGYQIFDKGNSAHFSSGKSMFSNKPADKHYKYYMFAYVDGIDSITFENGSAGYIPPYAFEGPYIDDYNKILKDPKPEDYPVSVSKIVFNQDIKLLGELPFYCPDAEDSYNKGTSYEDSFPHDIRSASQLSNVFFLGEGDDAAYSSRSSDNPYFTNVNGIIKNDNKKDITVDEILPGRGYTVGSTTIGENKELEGVTAFAPYAARDCDSIIKVDLSDTSADISEGTFFDCDSINRVILPDAAISVKSKAFGSISTDMNVDCTQKYGQYNLDDDAFERGNPLKTKKYPLVLMNIHREAEGLAKYIENETPHPNVQFGEYLKDEFLLYIENIDGSPLLESPYTVLTGDTALNYVNGLVPVHPDDPGKYVFKEWSGSYINPKETVKVNEGLVREARFIPVYSSGDTVNVFFYLDDDGTKILLTSYEDLAKGSTFTQAMYDSAKALIPQKPGYTPYMVGCPSINNPINRDYEVLVKYQSNSSSSSSSSSSTSSSGGGSTGGGGGGSSSGSSSSSKSSSSTSSSAYPVYVNSQDVVSAPAAAVAPGIGSTVYVDDGSSGGSGGSGSTGKKGSGNATVISTTGGISDTGKISATVNGSTDNYVIKITQTPEADQMGLQALHGAYGDDITPIRYLPFDISLYDSTGTNKISPVPEGVSVSITMPIPDDLAIYGGNAKIASTAGGVIEPMTPRFTVINGVPCMTYTCTHFSPYMVYVDTANLTEAGIADMTPKTADGIHPKWFLCFGLAAFAVVLFLKKDPEEYLKKAA